MYGREELNAMDAFTLIGMDFYEKSEADKVMDAYEARIKELENKNRNLQYSSDMWIACCKLMSEGKHNVMSSDAIAEMNRVKELEAENARLKAQVPKWHDLTNPLYTEDGVDYYDLPAEHGFYIVDCGGQVCTYSEFDPDYNDWCDLLSTTKVLRWCEFPATEESSATEKENE